MHFRNLSERVDEHLRRAEQRSAWRGLNRIANESVDRSSSVYLNPSGRYVNLPVYYLAAARSRLTDSASLHCAAVKQKRVP